MALHREREREGGREGEGGGEGEGERGGEIIKLSDTCVDIVSQN